MGCDIWFSTVIKTKTSDPINIFNQLLDNRQYNQRPRRWGGGKGVHGNDTMNSTTRRHASGDGNPIERWRSGRIWKGSDQNLVCGLFLMTELVEKPTREGLKARSIWNNLLWAIEEEWDKNKGWDGETFGGNSARGMWRGHCCGCCSSILQFKCE